MKLLGRYVLAILVAPFAVVPAVFVSVGIVELADPGQMSAFSEYVGMSFFLSAFGIVYGWFFLIVFGLPAFGVLAWTDLDHAIPSAVVGGLIGLLIGVTVLGFAGAWFSFVSMACGASVAGLFCRVVNGTWGPPNQTI